MTTNALLIETERVRAVYQHAPLTLAANAVNTGITGAVLAHSSQAGVLATWVVVSLAIVAVRAIVLRSARRRDLGGAQPWRWVAFSVLGSLASGLAWGMGAAMLFPASDREQLFLTFVVGGMCAGATTVNSSHLPTVLAFILPASLPLTVSFLIQEPTPHPVPALMLLLFAISLCWTSWRAHRSFGERAGLQLALAREQRSLSLAMEQLQAATEERRKAEAAAAQAQKMEAIGHLTGGIAHDFNNLLQIIGGRLAQIRGASPAGSRVLDYVRPAEDAVQQASQLTGSLLSFARRQRLEATLVDVNTLLEAFQPILRQAAGRGVSLELRENAGLPACRIDPTHFQAAILNLVLNARDAMPSGGEVVISLSLQSLTTEDLLGNTDAKPGDFIRVSVKDSGVGMTSDVLEKAFEPFFTTKQAGQGTGLGLPQVYGFARQSGGHVAISSAPGTGTCASLFLPVAES